MGQPPVGTISVVAERPSEPAVSHNAIANAEPPHTTTARSGQTPHGHGRRTSHGIQTSTPSSNEAVNSQSAHRASTRRPGNIPGT
jgi:hypothetical protein